MHTILRFCVRHPYAVITLIALITIGAALQIPKIRVDPRVEIFVDKNNPVRVQYENNRDEFSQREETIVGVWGGNIYTPQTLAEIRDISEAARRIPFIQDIKNILNMDYISGSASGIDVAPLSADGEVPATPAELMTFREKVASWDFFKGSFVNADHTGSLIYMTMREGTQTDDLIPIYYDLRRVVDRVQQRYPGLNELFITGVPVVNALTGDYMLRDMKVFVPIVNLIIIVTLFIFFRNLRGVVLPLVTVGISTTWTFGVMSLLGWPMTQLTSTLPVLLTAVGTAYGIHVLESVLSDAAEGKRGKQGIINAARRVYLPVIMAGLTTIGGFLSLLTTAVVPIKQLGVLASFGVFAALIISLTFIPAVLSILDSMGREFIPQHHTRHDVISPLLKGFTHLAVHRSSAVLSVCLIIILFSVAGMLRLRADMDPITYFKKSSPIRIADDFLNAKFAGTSMLNVVVRTGNADDIKNPAVLRRIELLQSRLNAIEGVGKSMSIVDLIKRMNQVMHDDDPRYYTIPDSRELIAQYLLLYSFSGSDEIERFVNHDYRNAQVILVIKSQGGVLAEKIFQEIAAFNRELPRGSGISVFATGISAITREFNHIVIQGQISSFILALILVILVTMPIFKSAKLGAFSILPLLIPILFNFGLMGFTGITLNAATALIASITVGVGIDYSIHFLSRYRYELGLQVDVPTAIANAINTTGRAVMYNALAVAAGFSVLILSKFVPVMQSGMLTALVMIISSTAALTALPAVINRFHPRIKAASGAQSAGQVS
ncbi:MAG: efflux RND transporter permease subunit [Syntrophaceae bacterium]